MQSLLMVIEHPSVMKDNLEAALPPRLKSRCELARWDSRIFDKLPQCKAELILVVAVPMAPQAIGLFKWFRENPIPTPTLAVLPSEVDSETLDSVSQSTDDFILWPIHKGE